MSSSAECSRDKPPFSFVRGQDSTMWDIIWVSPQGHRAVSVSRHFLLQAPRCPCSMRKRLAETTVADGGQNPVPRLWGRTLRDSWPPEPTSSYASIDFWCQLVVRPATAASWMSVVAIVGLGCQAGVIRANSMSDDNAIILYDHFTLCSTTADNVIGTENKTNGFGWGITLRS